jgi:sigma-B regulation protein RsbU (phosphoserine phosphatase)
LNLRPAFHPKQLYRELSRLLSHGEGAEFSREWFAALVDEIVVRLGATLLIDSGRVYEDRGAKGFELVHQVGSKDPQAIGVLIRLNYRPLQLLLQHGVFIFDPTVQGQSERLERRLGGMESAAVLIGSEPRRILAFGLTPGWERDDLDFTLHTMRNVIDDRIGVQHLKTDMNQAAEIQRSLLPTRAPELAGFTVAARSEAAEIVGGDFFDFLPGDPDTIVLAVGDASGHGLPAALLARDVVTGLRMGSERSLKITLIVNRLNRVIARSILSTRFVSLIYAELESNGNLFYVNAGHPPALISGPRGARRLTIGGTIIGPLATSVYKRGWAHVDRGDTLALVTDGLLEREDAAGNMFGEAGVLAVMEAQAGRPARDVLEAIFRAAAEYGGEQPWADDTTAVVIAREPGAERPGEAG